MDKIKVGVIGVGIYGEVHVTTYQSLPEVEVVAISDTREKRLDEISKMYGIRNCYTDYNDLCTRGDIDLVSIVTSEADHLGPVLAAADNQKHIFLEKPIATSLEDAKRIIEAAEKAKVLFMVGHILRFESKCALIKREIDKGHLGTIVSVHARRNCPRKLYPTYSRTHMIVENSIHDIDLCHWYTRDRVVNVRAFSRNIQKGQNPDINWSFLEFHQGGIACLETHWLIPDRAGIASNDALQVIGTRGIADVISISSGVSLWKEDGCEIPALSYGTRINHQMHGAIKEELGYFVECVRRGAAPAIIQPNDALEALRVALALVRSSAEGRDIKLP
jgi:predicted dehydrogenase